ncbi:MAG TPA: hypothetical protein VJR48_05955 [Ktedonobacterales bacterium]|nr:hypothetical protein [Ktedonobacterales bacterium]
MRLQQTGYGVKIALAAAFAVLVVVYDAFVVVHLITAGHFPAFLSPETLGIVLSALFLALTTVVICSTVWTLAARKRLSHSVATRDPAAVSEASPQRQCLALALHDGETLTLRRRYSLNAVFHSLVAIVYLPGIIFFGEMLIFLLLPSFGSSSLNPFYHADWDGPPAPPPTTIDWLTAALPVLLAVGIWVYAYWQSLRNRLSLIVADDAGISVRNGLWRRRVRWDEIDLFARTPDPRSNTVASPGSYVIWSRLQSLSFGFPGIEQEADYEPGSRSWSAHYSFDGGYNVYMRDAQRLLATIAARAHVPLLEIRDTSERASQSRREQAIAYMTEEHALALPLAEPRNMPSGDPASGELDEGETVSLRAHTWPQPVTGDWSSDFYIGLAMIWTMSAAMANVSHLWPLALALLAMVAVLVTFDIVLFVRRQRYRKNPDVSADASGLTTWGRFKDQPVTISWERITAWVVISPKQGTTKPFRYVVVGDGLRLAWSEPTYGQYTWQSASSPQGSYRKQAARLHALIAARTGLPLRELRTDAAQAIPARAM